MIIEDTYPALAVRAEELQSRGRRFKYQLHLLDGNLLRWKLKEKGQRTYENLQNNNLNISFFKKITLLLNQNVPFIIQQKICFYLDYT